MGGKEELVEVPHHHTGLSNKEIRVKLDVGDYVVLGPGANFILFDYRTLL